MSEAAMVGESEDWAFELGDNIEVWGFRSQDQRGGGERGFAIQSCTAHAGAGQQMGDGLQSFGETFLVQKLNGLSLAERALTLMLNTLDAARGLTMQMSDRDGSDLRSCVRVAALLPLRASPF